MQTIPLWYFTLLLYFVSSTLRGVAQRKVAQRSSIPLTLLAALLFLVVVYPAGVIYAFIQGDIRIDWSLTTIALILGSGLTIGLYNAVPLRLNKHIDATQYIIISNLYTPITVLLGVFVLKESFSLTQGFGTILLLLGAILVAIKGVGPKSWKIDTYSIYCALAAISLGVGLAIEKAALGHMSPGAYMIFAWGAQALVTLLFAIKELPAIRSMKKSDWVDVIGLGIFRTGGAFGFLLTIAYSQNVAFTAAITSFTVPLIFIASFFILREREYLLRKMLGVIIATIGLLLL